MVSLLDAFLGRLFQYKLRLCIFFTGFFARRRNAVLAACFLRPLIYRSPVFDTRSEATYNILLLPKSGFTDDMLACFKHSSRYTLWEVQRDAIKALCKAFLDPAVNDNNYAGNSASGSDKLAYRSFIKELWPMVTRRQTIHAVISGNFSYYAERELAAALEEMQVPFVVAHKECLKTSSQVRAWTHVYREHRGRFMGRAITVYNETEKCVLIEAGICDADRLAVVGCPRMDLLHDLRMSRETARDAGQRPRLLFFSFHPHAASGLPWIPFPADSIDREAYPVTMGDSNGKYVNAWAGMDHKGNPVPPLVWEQLSRNTHLAIREFALKNPDVDVEVKVKVGTHNEQHVRAIYKDALPENMTLVVGGPSLDSLRRAEIVCAFNSTAVLEAIAAGLPVVVPRFDEASDPASDDFLIHFGEAVVNAASIEELHAGIRRCIDRNLYYRDLTAAQIRVLEQQMGNADGKAGERFCRFLDSIAVP